MIVPGSVNPLLLQSAGSSAYQITRSLRFNAGDSAYLNRTPASGSNRKTWTWAGWVKRSTLGTEQVVWTAGASTSSGEWSALRFITTDQLQFINNTSNSTDINLLTAQVFRDASAWYHVLLRADISNATANDRIDIYINGTKVDAYSTQTQPATTVNTGINGAQIHNIGREAARADYYCNLYLAETYFIDGQALDPSSFTTTDLTTGQLIPKAYTGTYGTNGFQLKFADNSSNTAATLGKDTSPNGNNWTPNNFSVDGVVRNYASDVTTVATSVYSGTPATMFNGGTSIYYGVTSSSGNSSISINLTGKSVSVSSSVRVYASFRTGQVWQINGSTVSSSGVTHPNTGWQTLSGWSAGAITLFSSSVPSGSANEIYAIEIDGVILTNNTGAGNDSLVDTPTSISASDTGIGGQIVGNYATLNPLDSGSSGTLVLSNGNLEAAQSTGLSVYRCGPSTVIPNSGKYYAEFVMSSIGTGSNAGVGVIEANHTRDTYAGGSSNGVGYLNDGRIFINGSNTTNFNTFTTTDVIGVAVDYATGKVWFAKNNTWQNSGDPVAGTNAVTTLNPANSMAICGTTARGSSASGTTSFVANFGQRSWAYAAPAGYKCLVDTSLPAPTVAKPSTVMDVKLYTGNGSTQTISGLGFSPDLVWIKDRTNAYNHWLTDTVRGVSKQLSSSQTIAETSYTNLLTAFNSDGFSLGNDQGVNSNGDANAAWTWDAGASTVTNTAGSITSQVRANVSAGFSVVTFTGAGATATIGHGLGVEPHWIIVKNRTGSADNWSVYTKTSGAGNQIYLNLTNAVGGGSVFPSAPTSTLMTIGGGYVGSTIQSVAYCFAPVSGYSSMGSYVGNGSSSDGPFVFTGMRPRWVLIKQSSASGEPWFIYDTARSDYNAAQIRLNATFSSSETNSSSVAIDILSNGFKLRQSDAGINASSATYVYACFAESPFAYSRAR